MKRIETLNAKDAQQISAGEVSPTVDELFEACMASIWTSAIAGGESIGQSFDAAFTWVPAGDLRLQVVAKRLRRLGYCVTTGKGAFIDIDWSKPRKVRAA